MFDNSSCQSTAPSGSASAPKDDCQPSHAERNRCRRKTHSKSKNGCLRCKKRRVKCDEKKPQCTSCALRSYECIYPSSEAQELKFHFSYSNTTNNFSADSSTDNVVASSYQATPHELGQRSPVGLDLDFAQELGPAVPTASPTSTQRQMRLLHHYLTVTAGSFSIIDGIDPSLWTGHIPKIAFSAQHTMDALLTIAASHMKFLDPADNEASYAELHFRQLTLSGYNSALLEAPSTDTWEAIVSTGILLYVHSWSYIESEGGLNLGLDGLPCLTWRTRTMIDEQWLRHSSMSPFSQLVKLQTRADHPRRSQVPLLLAQLFPGLPDWSFDEMTLITDAVTDLLPMADAVRNNRLDPQVLLQSLSWVSMRLQNFVDSLRREDPRSLLLLGIYYALLRDVIEQFPDCWFAVRRTFEVQNGLTKILGENAARVAVDTIFAWLEDSSPQVIYPTQRHKSNSLSLS
ncbi:hypothetical protein F5884DRAFT_348462 [Xylogone sp. PMI_703]|nr:hypothetical protein F5884DRAFT_348462 [Xylogone sp. PMI_703]